MGYGADEEKGRFLLRALLWLVFICSAAGQVLYFGTLTRDTALYMTVFLAPTAVVLWAVHRGSWPALALFSIGTLYAIAGVTGTLVMGRGANLGDIGLIVDAVGMGLKMSVLFCVWRSATVDRWLIARRARRTRRSWVVELVLFLLAAAAYFCVVVIVVNDLLHMGA